MYRRESKRACRASELLFDRKPNSLDLLDRIFKTASFAVEWSIIWKLIIWNIDRRLLSDRLASFKRGTRYSRAGGIESVQIVNTVHELRVIRTKAIISTKGLYWDINLRYQSWEIREVYRQLEVEAEKEIQKFIWDQWFEIPNLSDNSFHWHGDYMPNGQPNCLILDHCNVK